MNYVESFNLLGVEAKQVPCARGVGAPTTSTEGAVGCLYMDTNTGYVYKCTSVANGGYTWISTDSQINDKQDKITGTSGQFVVIGSDGNVTTKTIPIAEEATF